MVAFPTFEFLALQEALAGRYPLSERWARGRVVAASGTYRPTEMAVSLAADRLFDELPKELRKGSLADDVRRAREAAEEPLSEVVAPLETIGRELLRMHAGMGSVESMTADLSSARSLSEDLERLVEAGR